MYSTKQRRIAIETFIKFDHSYADTIAEFEYPNRHTLNSWWRVYEATGEVPITKIIREQRLSDEQRRKAVEHYLSHSKKLKRTIKAPGYPESRMPLCKQLDERTPSQHKYWSTGCIAVSDPIKLASIHQPKPVSDAELQPQNLIFSKHRAMRYRSA